ncbi:hypothetical protein ACFRR7_27135 [Streptomyces sp. NPDC056909]|uniref:hypothetical protein n=1 Tax=Streptomyces sp. NPDC056909 TaxID=3345963 RepID=UPI0036B6B39D
MNDRPVRRIIATTLATVVVTAGLLAAKPHTGTGPERGGPGPGQMGNERPTDDRPGETGTNEQPTDDRPGQRPEGSRGAMRG